MCVQRVELSGHLLLAERCTTRVVHTTKTAEHLNIAEQVHDTRVLLPGRGDHYEQLPAGSQLRQAGFEVWTERVHHRLRQKSVLEGRLAEAAQQCAPLVVRTEQMVGSRVFVGTPIR